MSLIEQLGGYEKAKEWVNPSIEAISQGVLKSELLEYRRQHNIYEAGDLVVLLNWDNNNRLLTIKRIYEHKLYKNGEYYYSTFIYYVNEWSHDRAFSKNDIRHATDAEIAAGCRL